MSRTLAIFPEVEAFLGHVKRVFRVLQSMLKGPSGIIKAIGLCQHSVQLLHEFAPPEGDIANALPEALRALALSDVGSVVRVPVHQKDVKACC